MRNKIELLNVKKSFDGKVILRGINLRVPDKRSTVIIGGSGTGKSMTLKCILGLINPDSGKILIDGKPPKTRDNFFGHFGMLFQSSALFDSLTIWENVAFRLLNGSHKIRRADAKFIAIEKLRRVGLSADISDQFPAQISGGMQKRVGLARAIATDPQVLFFDEPTSGLDPVTAHVINDLIREIVDELGATALTITHSMETVRQIADRVAFLNDGVIRWTGRVKDIDNSGDPYVEQFINGSPDGPISPYL